MVKFVIGLCFILFTSALEVRGPRCLSDYSKKPRPIDVVISKTMHTFLRDFDKENAKFGEYFNTPAYHQPIACNSTFHQWSAMTNYWQLILDQICGKIAMNIAYENLEFIAKIAHVDGDKGARQGFVLVKNGINNCPYYIDYSKTWYTDKPKSLMETDPEIMKYVTTIDAQAIRIIGNVTEACTDKVYALFTTQLKQLSETLGECVEFAKKDRNTPQKNVDITTRTLDTFCHSCFTPWL